jgi:hypothetical protein
LPVATTSCGHQTSQVERRSTGCTPPAAGAGSDYAAVSAGSGLGGPCMAPMQVAPGRAGLRRATLTGTPAAAAWRHAASTPGVSCCLLFSSVPSTSEQMSRMSGTAAPGALLAAAAAPRTIVGHARRGARPPSTCTAIRRRLSCGHACTSVAVSAMHRDPVTALLREHCAFSGAWGAPLCHLRSAWRVEQRCKPLRSRWGACHRASAGF